MFLQCKPRRSPTTCDRGRARRAQPLQITRRFRRRLLRLLCASQHSIEETAPELWVSNRRTKVKKRTEMLKDFPHLVSLSSDQQHVKEKQERHRARLSFPKSGYELKCSKRYTHSSETTVFSAPSAEALPESFSSRKSCSNPTVQ